MNAPLTKEQTALLMSDSLTYRSSAVEGAGARPSIWQTLRQAVSGFAATLRAIPQRRAVLNELSTLTDRELADIGLHRSELGRVFDPRFAQARNAVN